MKRLIFNIVAYLLPSLACWLVAKELIPQGVWHDALILISGVLLGGVAVQVSLISIELNKRTLSHDVNKLKEGK